MVESAVRREKGLNMSTVFTQDEASRIAYSTGIRELAPLIRRIMALEATVEEQVTQISALQSTFLRLKYPGVEITS